MATAKQSIDFIATKINDDKATIQNKLYNSASSFTNKYFGLSNIKDFWTLFLQNHLLGILH